MFFIFRNFNQDTRYMNESGDQMKRLAHSSCWGGAILLGVSFVARAYGLGFPQYHWDENIDFNNVFSASFNHLAILAYDHGSLHPYLILIVWKLYLLVTDAGTTTSALIHTFLADPTTLVILARGLIVLASTGTVAMVFFLARRLYNNRVAWLSSILLAGTFLHTAESHYARTHVLAAFFLILTLYFCSRILETGNQTDY